MTLCDGVVRVWLRRLRATASSSELLSLDERRRAASLSVERARSEYVGGRVFLRELLGEQVGVAPQRLRFAVTELGKPYVTGGAATDVRFSVSHSGGLAVIAVTLQREVGVDVERLRPIACAERVAEGYLPAADHARVSAASPRERDRAFLRGWVRAEALTKAWGRGLAALDDVRRLEDRTGVFDPDWTVRSLRAPDGYLAAVAAEGADWR